MVNPAHVGSFAARALYASSQLFSKRGDPSIYASHAADIAQVLVDKWYDDTRGAFAEDRNWWHTFNTIQALADFILANPDAAGRPRLKDSLHHVFSQVYTKTRYPPLDQLSDAPIGVNSYTDDSMWGGHALITLFDIYGDYKYLNAAKEIFVYLDQHDWTTQTCGGGLFWNKDHLIGDPDTYKNAVSNELYISLAAKLANRVRDSDEEKLINKAKLAWVWLKESAMMKDNKIYDGLFVDDEGCKTAKRDEWTYNSGIILGALNALDVHEHDRDAYIHPAMDIAKAARAHFTKDDILVEKCENENPNGCDLGAQHFKGAFVRGLRQVCQYDGDSKAWAMNMADHVWDNRYNDNTFGPNWAGKKEEAIGPNRGGNVAGTTSALDLMNLAQEAAHDYHDGWDGNVS